MTKREVSVRFLINQLKEQRKVLDYIDWIAAETSIREDQHRLWAIRIELVKIFERDISLKKGITLGTGSSESVLKAFPYSKEDQTQMFEQARIERPTISAGPFRRGLPQ